MSLGMSMICLGPNPKLSGKAIVAELAKRWPSLPKTSIDLDQKVGVVNLTIGSMAVLIARMPMPIPWSDLEWPCESSWLWKDAAEVLRTHETHLIVTVFEGQNADNDSVTKVDRTRILTQVTAAILASCPAAVGVYWTQAKMVIQPPVFIEMATKLIQRPYYLWVNFQIGTNAQGKLSGYTIGMEPLGLMDLETVDCPESKKDLHDRMVGLVNYLLDNGLVIRDGDTFGETANEQIRAVYADSAFGREEQVMRLEYGRSSPVNQSRERPSTRRQTNVSPVESTGMSLNDKIYSALVALILVMGGVVLTMMIFDPARDQAKGAPLMIGLGSVICAVLAGTLVWNIKQDKLVLVPTVFQILALFVSCLGTPVAIFGMCLLAKNRSNSAE